MKAYTHKLTKVGKHSYAIVIPIDMVKKLKWRERQRLKIELRGDTVKVRDA